MPTLMFGRSAISLLLIAMMVTSCSTERQREKAWQWPDQPLGEYLYKPLSDIPKDDPHDGITVDSIYQDVSMMIDPDSDATLEVPSDWVVVSICGDHPTSSPELTQLEASIIPRDLLSDDVKRRAERGQFLGPLNCPDGWTTAPSSTS